MSEICQPKVCGLFKPGHTPHWIQMSRATEDRNNLPVACRFIDAHRDGNLVIEVDGRELRVWNHEPERLAEAVARSGEVVEYQPRWGLLWLPSEGGRYAFTVALGPADDVHCPPPPQVGGPAELLESAGGFSISANDLPNARLQKIGRTVKVRACRGT